MKINEFKTFGSRLELNKTKINIGRRKLNKAKTYLIAFSFQVVCTIPKSYDKCNYTMNSIHSNLKLLKRYTLFVRVNHEKPY